MAFRTARKDSRSTGSVSLLDTHAVVRGDLESDGTVRVDGRLEGSILRADVVVVGASGAVHGDIRARTVTIAGSVRGAVDAAERLELQPGAELAGDVRTASLVVHEGAALRGRVIDAPDAFAANDASADAPTLTVVDRSA